MGGAEEDEEKGREAETNLEVGDSLAPHGLGAGLHEGLGSLALALLLCVIHVLVKTSSEAWVLRKGWLKSFIQPPLFRQVQVRKGLHIPQNAAALSPMDGARLPVHQSVCPRGVQISTSTRGIPPIDSPSRHSTVTPSCNLFP